MQLRGLKGRINDNYYWSCFLINAAKTHERFLFQTKANRVLKEALLILCSLILGDDLRPREITSADGRVKLGCLFKKRLPPGWDTPIIHGCVCLRAEACRLTVNKAPLWPPTSCCCPLFSKNTACRHASHTYVYIHTYLFLSWPPLSHRCSVPFLSPSHVFCLGPQQTLPQFTSLCTLHP